MLKISNLLYTYEQTNISFKYDFSCSVNAGEIVSIMGESGSGKSTFLDLLAGFLRPLSGEILFDNKELKDLPTEKRPITILFQNYNLFEHLSVLKNVLLGINSFKEDDVYNAKKILLEVGLKDFEEKIASSLSGGQMQRVALARSLIRKTPILLLDEPFNGLDFDTKVKMLDLVRDITKRRGLYTIMVTHDTYDSEYIADKKYTVKDGQFYC